MTADVLNIGRSGLHTTKKQLATAGHNISNANNEAYSRQRVHSQSSTPIQEGNYTIGTGTNIRSIKRIHDEFIEKKLDTSITNKNYFEERNFHLQQVENVFNEVNSDGLNKVVNKFFNAFRELSTNPESDTLRSIVRETAKNVTDDFKRISNELVDISDSINKRVVQSVEDVNAIISNVSKLNVKITEMEVSGGETGDLRDQRDEAIRTLSEFLKIHTYVDNRGQFNISADGMGTLVSGETTQDLSAALDSDGKIQIFYTTRPSSPISSYLKGGKIEALLKTREKELESMKSQMDNLAFDLANFTNAIHKRGFANREVPTDLEGQPLPELSTKKVTGINFFKAPESKKNAAGMLELSSEVLDDVNNIAVSFYANSPGDNRVALAISKLQHEKVLAEGTSSFEETYLKSIGEIGLASGKTSVDLEQAVGIHAQVKQMKERISGVSLDEETSDMVKFQHAYEASARVIRIADEMFDAVIGIMR